MTPQARVTLCSPVLTQEPWRFDAPLPPHYGPGSSQDDVIPAHAPVQQTLPSAYCTLTSVELDERIRRAKAALGTRLVVLGHHYQRDEIIRHADLRGDSFKLSQQAAERADADYIVFCGENGGIVCTSSNAERVLGWAFERGERVLFFPDQHLGRNTAYHMGVPLDQMVVWDPREPLGGNSAARLRAARVVLWK